MSDELSPPPLRLKPRVKPDTGTSTTTLPGTSPFAAESATAPDDSSEAPRFKLRPKLDLEDETPAKAVESVLTETAAAPVRPVAFKPRMSLALPVAETPAAMAQPATQAEVVAPPLRVETAPTTPVQASTPGEPPTKFKLKEKAPAPSGLAPAAGSTSASSPPIAVPAAAPSTAAKPAFSLTPPPFPVIADPATSDTSSPLPPPLPNDAGNGTARSRRSPLTKILFAVLIATLVSGGYLGYLQLTEPVVPAAIPVATPAPRPETPSTTLNEISKIPAESIKKAEAAIAAVNAKDAAGVQVVLSEETPVKRPAKVVPKVAETPVKQTTSTSQLSPGLSVTTASKDVTGDASPAFRAWVAQAKVSGVFQGTPARVLINGRTVPAGQIVDDALVITFEGIDPKAKLLVFRDSTGASVTRRF